MAREHDALQAYIDAREAWEALRDDIAHGSAEECRAAHQHIRQARINYDTAIVEASQAGVLETGRLLFR
jgi:multidrug resistance efflux pump